MNRAGATLTTAGGKVSIDVPPAALSSETCSAQNHGEPKVRTSPRGAPAEGDRAGRAREERKQVTVLFADVQGSMELAAQVDQDDWRPIMDRFFAILAFMREGNDAAALGRKRRSWREAGPS